MALATAAPASQTIAAKVDSPLPDQGGKGSNPTTPQKRHAPKVLVSTSPATTAETEKVNAITQLFVDARNYRRPLVKRWKENQRLLYNQFWDVTRPTWQPSPQIPEIWPIVDALVSWEMDQQPQYTISPQALPHTDYASFFNDMAQNLEVVLTSSFKNNAEAVQWAIANYDKYVYGTGFVKTTWDMTLAGGLGDATTRRVSPFYFYPDPQASSLDDANYFIEARRMSIQELDRRYPGTANMFPSGGTDYDIDKEPSQLDRGGGYSNPPLPNPGAIPPATTPRFGPPGALRSVDGLKIPGITVLECWMREHETYRATDPSTGESITKVYDTWRLIVVAGSRIIMDEPTENLWIDGGHPYDRLVVRDTGEFWGHSLVQLLSSAQRSLNRIIASVQQNVELTGNPIFRDAGTVGRQQMTNRPGQVLRQQNNPAAAAASDWLKPPQLNAAIPQMMTYLLQRMQDVSGLTAILKGGSPPGRNAEGVIDALQEAGFVRVRSSLQFLEAAMRGAGQKKAALIIDNYNTNRIVAIAGPGGERTSLALRARHFMIPTSKGATPLRYQLMVDIGSQRATSRTVRENQAVQLFTLGAIDNQALLEDVNYPNASVVAARVQQQQMALAAQGQQMGPGKRQQAGH